MNCSQSQAYMMKYFDKEINDIEEAQLKQHLKTCSNCSEEFTGLKDIFTQVEQLPGIDPPEDFELQVMNRIQNETKMFKKPTTETAYVYNILLIVLSLSFVTLLGSIVWDTLIHPLDMFKEAWLITDLLKQFYSAAISTFKGIAITVVGVATSLYKTYYYAYILLGILLLVIQKIFITMLKDNRGGAQ